MYFLPNSQPHQRCIDVPHPMLMMASRLLKAISCHLNWTSEFSDGGRSAALLVTRAHALEATVRYPDSAPEGGGARAMMHKRQCQYQALLAERVEREDMWQEFGMSKMLREAKNATSGEILHRGALPHPSAPHVSAIATANRTASTMSASTANNSTTIRDDCARSHASDEQQQCRRGTSCAGQAFSNSELIDQHWRGSLAPPSLAGLLELAQIVIPREDLRQTITVNVSGDVILRETLRLDTTARDRYYHWRTHFSALEADRDTIRVFAGSDSHRRGSLDELSAVLQAFLGH
eukprot:IDg6212t1